MKAGTDPAKVKVISDALAKVAASAEYMAYLRQQYATDDSYFPAKEAARIMADDLKQMRGMVGSKAPK
jgi:tripartite-type tricarboxylate transporter receptor subunit TctC